MSYEIVKSIAIKDDKVYLTSASNNVSPRTFERWESKSLSDIYQKQGMAALLKALAAQVWEGNFHLQRGSQMCRNLEAAMDVLTYNKNMRSFLDTDRAAQFMSDFVMNILGKGPMPDVSKLYALRGDKEAVIDICKKNPSAFHYAAPEIQADRDAAKAYIENCCNQIMFSMPRKFAGDKELAMLALQGSGCVYRQLCPSLQADKEITKLAFDPNLPRPHFEHLPDLIPESLRKDRPFMLELVALCPRMHLSRAQDLIQDKDMVKTWLAAGNWGKFTLHSIPAEVLRNPEVQQSMFASGVSEETKAAAKEYLASIGVPLAKPKLANVVQIAQGKRTDTQEPGRESQKVAQR